MITDYYFNTTNLGTWDCYPTKVTGNLDFLSRKAIPGNEVYYSDGANLRVDADSIVFQERTIQFEAVIVGTTRLQAFQNYDNFVEFLNSNQTFTFTTPYGQGHNVMINDPAAIRIINKMQIGTLYVLKVKADFIEMNPDDSLTDKENPATPVTGVSGGSFMDEAELKATYKIYNEYVGIYSTPEVKPMPENFSIYRTGRQHPATTKRLSAATHIFKGYFVTDTVEEAMLKLRQFKHDLFKPGFRRFEFSGRRVFYAACTDGGAVKFRIKGGYMKNPVIVDFSLNLYEAIYNSSNTRYKLNFDGVDQYGELSGDYIDDVQTLDFLVDSYTASSDLDYLIFEKTGSSGIYLNNSGNVGVRINGTNYNFNYNNSNLTGNNRITVMFEDQRPSLTAKLFVDGTFVDSFTITGEYKSTCQYLLCGDLVFLSPSVFTNITLKELRAWSKEFSNSDITSGRHLYNSTALKLRFTTIAATDESMIDESGNGNHFQLFNNVTKEEY